MSIETFMHDIIEKLYVEGYAYGSLTTMTYTKRGKLCNAIALTVGNMKTCVCTDELYQDYRSGLRNLDECYRRVSMNLMHRANYDSISQLIEDLSSFDTAKKHLRLRVLNATECKGALYIPWFDWGIEVCMMCEVPDLKEATIVCTQNMLDLWSITLDEAKSIAEHNMIQEGYFFDDIASTVEKFTGESDLIPEFIVDTVRMYILTSNSLEYGAAYVTIPEVQKRIAEVVGSNYYILPSSIHEVMILPCNGQVTSIKDVDKLKEMVRSINREEIDPKDFLSDTVLKYSIKMNKVLPV